MHPLRLILHNGRLIMTHTLNSFFFLFSCPLKVRATKRTWLDFMCFFGVLKRALSTGVELSKRCVAVLKWFIELRLLSPLMRVDDDFIFFCTLKKPLFVFGVCEFNRRSHAYTHTLTRSRAYLVKIDVFRKQNPFGSNWVESRVSVRLRLWFQLNVILPFSSTVRV